MPIGFHWRGEGAERHLRLRAQVAGRWQRGGQIGKQGTDMLAKCWQLCDIGGEGGVRLGVIDVPAPGPHELVIRVHAAALNPIDLHRIRGDTTPSRPIPLPQTIGYDFSGTVQECGTMVTSRHVGDEVFGCVHRSGSDLAGQQGALQDYIVVHEHRLVSKPTNISFIEAASLGVVASTAIQAFEFGRLAPGDTVLITGGAGGVGSMAIQMAKKMFGAGGVWASVRSREKAEQCKQLGADHVLLTTADDSWTVTKFPDVSLVLDCTGEGRRLHIARQKAKSSARIVSISTFDEPNVEQFAARTGRRKSLQRLAPYLASGKIRPVLDVVFPFHAVPSALKYMAEGHASGKVVIDLTK